MRRMRNLRLSISLEFDLKAFSLLIVFMRYGELAVVIGSGIFMDVCLWCRPVMVTMIKL